MEIAQSYPRSLLAMTSTMTLLENENTAADGKLVHFSKLSSMRTLFCTEKFVLRYKIDAWVSLFGGEPTYYSPNLLMLSL